MNRDIDTNIQDLLEKYAGGRVPPLTNPSSSKLGLISQNVLKLYRSGFTRQYSTPMGMLLPARDLPAQLKWDRGDYTINRWSEPNWAESSKKLGEGPEDHLICEACDRKSAFVVETLKDVVAHMCDHGFINLAAPIVVKNQVVAILFCGQFKPDPTTVWNLEMVEPDGHFRPLRPGEAGTEIQSESQRRMNSLEKKLRLQGLLQSMSEYITPEEVVRLQDAMRAAAKDMADLATSTYKAERGQIVDWMKNRVTQPVLLLNNKSVDLVESRSLDLLEVWNHLSSELVHVIRYFGVDYMMILSLHDDFEKSLRLLCQAGLPSENLPTGINLQLNAAAHRTIASIFSQSDELTSHWLSEYKDLPLFDHLYRIGKHKKSQFVSVMPLRVIGTSMSLIVILGGARKENKLAEFLGHDIASLRQIIHDVMMATELVLLIEQLAETTRTQARFLEDVAHDIRTPIQNLIVQAEALKLDLDVNLVRHIGQEMARQARRLNRMNSRIWTMVSIERGHLRSEAPEPVMVYQILIRNRKLLLDLAERRGIQISINKALEGWPPVYLQKTLFSQAVLNLMDNAIKYSRDETEIRIRGKWLPDGISLNIANRGICLREEDQEKIFERYYRTKEAQLLSGSGTGIGLYIVKWFVDQAGGKISVRSDPVPGSQTDYVTVFDLFIPHNTRR